MPVRTLLHVFPGFGPGGAQMRFASVANHLGPTYRHLIVAMNGATEAVRLLAPELKVELLTIPVQIGNSWRNLKIFTQTLRRLQPDLLVTSNWGSIEWGIANWAAWLPHVHLEDGFSGEEAERQFSRRVWVRRLVLRRSTVVVPSRTLYRIARQVWRLPAPRLLYVPNGVDCDRFTVTAHPTYLASAGILNSDIPLVGTVARLSPEKNLHRLVDAFAMLVRDGRRALLVIVGDGPERDSLTEHVRAKGLESFVVFTGKYTHPERLLPHLSVFALSSDTEQMPLSVLEAMAAGVPIAATDVGDVREMLSEQNQDLVVEKDSGMLASAIARLLDEPDRARRIGAANARRARERYDHRKMFETYHDLFNGKLPPTEESVRVHG
jgi:glycosyltransferase involved in cell wall biosynthesis